MQNKIFFVTLFLDNLFLQKKMNQGLLEELLLMASKAHNTEAFLWLLEQKQALYGFEKGDMEL